MKKKILITTVLIGVVLCACTSEPKLEETKQPTIEATTVEETTVEKEVEETTTVEEYGEEKFLQEVEYNARQKIMPSERVNEVKLEDKNLVITIYLKTINKKEQKINDIMKAVLKIEEGLNFWETITVSTSEKNFTKSKEEIEQ